MIRPVVKKELGDALRNRWVGAYALVVALLGFVAALVGARSTGGMALQMFGRTTATLTNLSLMLAPLVALVVGGASIAGERDRGTLERLLSLPLTPAELVSSKLAGLILALWAATLAGFVPAAVMVGALAGRSALAYFLIFPCVTLLLVAAMAGVGTLISVISRSAAQALGSAVLLWFALVLLYDLLLIGTLASIDLPPAMLAFLLLINPVDSARVLVVLLLEPDLYALGPAGIFLSEMLGRAGAGGVLAAALAFWSVAPAMLSRVVFERLVSGPRSEKKDARGTSSGVERESDTAISATIDRERKMVKA